MSKFKNETHLNPLTMSDINSELIKRGYDKVEAEKIQKKYSKNIELNNLQKHDFIDWDSIETIAAIDISYFHKDQLEYGIACAILWDFKKNQLKKFEIEYEIIDFPYLPGFLGFREVPLMVKALQKMSIKPDIIICDGHGIIHPYRFGEATHIGYALNIPSIGIAKKPFIGKSNPKYLSRRKGEKAPILEGNDILGYLICLANNQKPVYISIGYNIEIELAIEVALYLSKDHKQPEPLYLADKISRESKKNILA